jgi:hypothetical protein
MSDAGIRPMKTKLRGFAARRELLRQHDTITMSPATTAYLVALAVATIGITVPLLTDVHVNGTVFGRFAALAGAAAVAQLFVVRAPRNQIYHTTIVFLLAAVLLLPAALLPFVAIVQHVPVWVARRQRLRFLAFNTLNHALDMLAAAGVAALVLDAHRRPNLTWALAGAAAMVTLVGLNHLLLAIMISITRGFTLRESGLFSSDSLAADLVPATLGLALATFWLWAPWLLPTAILPLFLIQRSLVLLPNKLQPTGA